MPKTIAVYSSYPYSIDKDDPSRLAQLLTDNFIEAYPVDSTGFGDDKVKVKIFGGHRSVSRQQFITSKGWWTIRSNSMIKNQETGEIIYHTQINTLEGEYDWSDFDWSSFGTKEYTSKQKENEEELVAQGFNNRLLTRKEFQQITSSGCSFCGGNSFVPADSQKFHWIDASTFLCQACCEADQNQEKLFA